jgi:hypothetical protein
MAAQYYLQKRIIGGFADFIPHGETVDALTTSPLVIPDDDPITNWTDYSLGCIQEVQFDSETEDEEDYCPAETGGYSKSITRTTVRDTMTLTLKDHSEPIFRLLFGLNQKLTGLTGQQPFENLGDREITGWLRLRGVGSAAEALAIVKVEVKMRISDYPGWSQTAAKPVVEMEVIANTLNDLTDDAILAA